MTAQTLLEQTFQAVSTHPITGRFLKDHLSEASQKAVRFLKIPPFFCLFPHQPCPFLLMPWLRLAQCEPMDVALASPGPEQAHITVTQFLPQTAHIYTAQEGMADYNSPLFEPVGPNHW